MDGTLEDMRKLAAEHGSIIGQKSNQMSGSEPAEDVDSKPEHNDESLERIVASLYQELDIA